MFSCDDDVAWAMISILILILIMVMIMMVMIREGVKKNRLFLGKSPKLWVGGGQES